MSLILATLRTHIRERVIAAAHRDTRILGLVDYGSSSEGRADAFSDLDLALFLQDGAFESFQSQWKVWAAQFGPVLLAYVGGVGHPWTVYDATPLPLRVDFAFHRTSALDVVLRWPNAPELQGSDGSLRCNGWPPISERRAVGRAILAAD